MTHENTQRGVEPLGPHSSRGDFVRSFLEAGLLQLASNERLLRSDPSADPESVRQARVATRRLRSNLRSFRSLLDRNSTDDVRIELRWIAGLLGSARGPEVVGRWMHDAVQGADLRAGGLPELRAILDGQRDLARTNLLSALGGDRYRTLITDLRQLADDPPVLHPSRPVAPDAESIVRQRWKATRAIAASIDADGDIESLHRLRKHIKAVRYAAQAAKPLGFGSRGLVPGLGRVQDELGELNDAVDAARWLDRQIGTHRVSPDAAYLAGQLSQVASSAAHLRRSSWRGAWDRVRDLRIT